MEANHRRLIASEMRRQGRVGGAHGNLDLEMADLMNMQLGPEARHIVRDLYRYMEARGDVAGDTQLDGSAAQNFAITDPVMRKKWDRLMDIISQNAAHSP